MSSELRRVHPSFLKRNYSISLSDPINIENSKHVEESWVTHIKKALRKPQGSDLPPSPSIFMAPSPLRSLKHEAFVPQVVALGPYHSDLGPHHSSFPRNEDTERYKAIAAKEMEMHKVMASKYVEKTLIDQDFSSLCKEFLNLVALVRAEYSTELITCTMDEKLAYMLALDASFVVEVLKSNVGMRWRQGGFHTYYCNRFPRPLRKSVLQDFVLLENQIPLFLLLKVIRMGSQCESDEKAEQLLGTLVEKVAKEVLPFDLEEFGGEESVRAITKNLRNRKHLLDILYGIVILEGDRGGERETSKTLGINKTTVLTGESSNPTLSSTKLLDIRSDSGSVEGVESSLGAHVPPSEIEPIQNDSVATPLSTSNSSPTSVKIKNGGQPTHLRGSSITNRIKSWFSNMLWSSKPEIDEETPGGQELRETVIETHEHNHNHNHDHSKLVEAANLNFLRAAELHNSGITFKPIKYGSRHGISKSRTTGVERAQNMVSVRYDERRAILYLPKIRVGDDTEGFFRNLIAYESQMDNVDAVGVLSYLRFMNSLVDTPEDVALLVEKGIIAQDIGSNEEVAMMWNQLCVNTMRVCNPSYEKVAMQLSRHSQRKMNALKAEFKRIYLSRPWFLVSLLSGASVIIMTLLTMLYTIALYEVIARKKLHAPPHNLH